MLAQSTGTIMVIITILVGVFTVYISRCSDVPVITTSPVESFRGFDDTDYHDPFIHPSLIDEYRRQLLRDLNSAYNRQTPFSDWRCLISE